MAKFFLIFLHILLLASWIATEDGTDKQNGESGANELADKYVLELTDDNLEETIDVKENILVEFYAPWCGHCKSLTPEYAKAAEILSKDGIVLAKIDATANEKMASKFEVSGYPTLLYFRNGTKYDFEGERTADGIVSWMRERSSPHWKPPPSTVLDLTLDTFTDVTTNSDLILVEFYAPWCGHCKRLAPEFEKASRELVQFGIKLAKVDAMAEETLKTMFRLTGYPTLKLFRKGREYEYKGPRDAQGIIKYMKEEAVPASKLQNEKKQLENALKRNEQDSTIIGFFENPEQRLYKEYEVATNEMRGEHRFFHTFQRSLADDFKVKPGTIVIFKPELLSSKYEKSRYEFEEKEATSVEIVEFVRNNVVPLVGHRTRKNMDTLHKKRPLVVVYYDVNFSLAYRKDTQIIRSEIVEVAKAHPKVLFCISSESEFQDELKNLGLDDSGEDVNVGLYGDGILRYPMEPEESFNSRILQQFVSSALNGEIQPHFKSQSVPKKNDGPVKVVVAKSFSELVEKNDKDVLLEFYAPWCGHCKALEPIYLKVAKQLKDQKKLLVAKMDATANDVPPPFEVSGFPTIYFVPKDDKQHPVVFDETERDVKTIVKFVQSHLSATNTAKDEL